MASAHVASVLFDFHLSLGCGYLNADPFRSVLMNMVLKSH